MKVYLLAAGFATRMYPLTRDMAKPLLDVGGAPILSHIMRKVEDLPDLTEVVVIGNHRFYDALLEWRESCAFRVPIVILNDGASEAEERLGAVGDLAFALERVPTHGEDFLVIAGDNLFDFELLTLYEEFKGRNMPLLVTRHIDHSPGQSPYNEISVDVHGRVLSFREKPLNPVGNLSAIAMYFLTSGTERRIEQYLAGEGNSDAPGHFISWLVSRVPVSACPMVGTWFDIGSLEKLDEARAFYQP